MKVIFTNSKLEFESVRPKTYVTYNPVGYVHYVEQATRHITGLNDAEHGFTTLPILIDDFSKIVIEKAWLSSGGWLVSFYDSKPFDSFEQPSSEIKAGMQATFLPDISILGNSDFIDFEINLADKKLAGARYVILSHYKLNDTKTCSAYLQ